MLDTNILISALIFKSKIMNDIIDYIAVNHTIVISSYVVDELHSVIKRKFPTKMLALETLLSSMSYELVYTPKIVDFDLFCIRDVKDYPVLYTAIIDGIDILITGDKDFANIDIEKPDILTPNEFSEKYL